MMSLFVLAIVLAAVALSAAGRFIVRKIVPPGRLEQAHETVGIFFGAIGLIYSLILAFALLSVWEDYEELRGIVAKEAATIRTASRHAEASDLAIRQTVVSQLEEYRERIVFKENWSSSHGHQKGSSALLQSTGSMLMKEMAGASDRTSYSQLLADLDDLEELQQDRLRHATAHMPPIIWTLLIAGSLLMIVCSWLFTAADGRLHIFLSASLSVLILLCLFALYRLDHPLHSYKASLQAEYLAR